MTDKFNNNEILNAFAFDENNDGILDNIVGYKKDTTGKIVEVSLDYDGDNKADTKIFFEYNSDGRIIKKYIDKNFDDNIDSIEIYEYDENGNITKKYDDNADGKIDYIERINDDGELIVEDIRDLKQKVKEALTDVAQETLKDLKSMISILKK